MERRQSSKRTRKLRISASLFPFAPFLAFSLPLLHFSFTSNALFVHAQRVLRGEFVFILAPGDSALRMWLSSCGKRAHLGVVARRLTALQARCIRFPPFSFFFFRFVFVLLGKRFLLLSLSDTISFFDLSAESSASLLAYKPAPGCAPPSRPFVPLHAHQQLQARLAAGFAVKGGVASVCVVANNDIYMLTKSATLVSLAWGGTVKWRKPLANLK